MKIEFIKETKSTGDVIYYTNVDNTFVSNSLSLTEEAARAIFERIKAGTFTDMKEVIESVDIN
jgi:hypothetical protein